MNRKSSEQTLLIQSTFAYVRPVGSRVELNSWLKHLNSWDKCLHSAFPFKCLLQVKMYSDFIKGVISSSLNGYYIFQKLNRLITQYIYDKKSHVQLTTGLCLSVWPVISQWQLHGERYAPKKLKTAREKNDNSAKMRFSLTVIPRRFQPGPTTF